MSIGAVSLGSGDLLERADEVARIDEVLAAAGDGSGALLLIGGPAGIGKTCLLEMCAERARDREMHVSRVRGDELLMESSFAGVRELFWRQVQELGPTLWQGAARFAAPVFEGQASAGADRDRAAAALHGLYWLVAGLAEQAPMLLLIDDAHWLDAASARFLIYLARRVEALPVLVAVAVRQGEGSDAIGLRAALEGLASSVLRPQPLSEDASGMLVRRILGARADQQLCRSCHEATGGNPFYLRELTAAVRAERGRPTVEVAAGVRALGAGAIGRNVLVRLSRLGVDCEQMARALAVLGPGSPLRHATMLAGLERARGEVAADILRAADVLAAGQVLSFVHPIVQEAVAADIAPSLRAALHARAASLLAAEGAQVDRVAAHLLSAEPYGEAWVVDALRRAAGEALARGAPEAAVSYLRRALAEPPAPEIRLDLLVELGRAETMLPSAHDFNALREALSLASSGQQRGEIALELAWGLSSHTRNSEVAVLLSGVLDDNEDLDPELVQRIEGVLIGGGAPDLTTTHRALARAAPHFDRVARGDGCDALVLAPALAQTGAITGRSAAEAAELARLALREDRLLDFPPAYMAAAGALSWCDGLDEAAEALDAAIAEAQRRGSTPMFMQMSTFRAGVAFRAGQLDVAEDHAQRAYELGRELGVGHWRMMFLIPIVLERGRAEEALEMIQSLELGEPALRLWQGAIVLAHRGRARCALGELEPGIADMLDADRRMADAGCHLSVLADWVPYAALAVARLGRDDEAKQIADRELADAHAFGAPRRYGIALSVCGLLHPGARGLERLREAVSILERSPARLEHARALVNLGIGLRARGGRETARDPLAAGLDLADRCGANALVEQAHAELIATGARPRREALSGPAALTPAELRTARMASGGLANREIAQALFVSTKTVETQLSHAYAKLGIHSRTELRAALTSR